jgi:hypothetical protein
MDKIPPTGLPPIFSKDDLIGKLKEIKSRGWIKTQRPGNDGAVGNTLEDLLNINENNLPIPNAAEWELKAQRRTTGSLTTLFHTEPSPKGAKIVSSILLPCYGWIHKQAGKIYPSIEKSFRSTTGAVSYTDRGFIVLVDRKEEKVKFSFNAEKVDKVKHKYWLTLVESIVGLGEINPQPFWGFKDLMYKAGSKLKNTFYVLADSKWEGDDEYFLYREVDILTDFDFDGFLECIEKGVIVIDFDARSGHNHGTKFRIHQNSWPMLYKNCTKVV